MIFQRLSRTDPERVFVVVQNNSGSTMNKDTTAQLDLASASIDGVKVRVPAASNEWAFMGIIDANIAANDYGLCQVYGYRSTSLIFQTNTSQDTGVPLGPSAGNAYLVSLASTTASTNVDTQVPIFAVLGESIVNSAASSSVSRKIFIRAL